MDKDYSLLESKLGMEFENRDLLIQALTHRSYINENPGFDLDHNERLEFLGDAVLELIVTDYLYRNYPNPEGELTNWRSALVNSKMLSQVADSLEIDDFLLLSRGESQATGRGRECILGNSVEALIGAIYLDQGYDSAEEFIKKNIISHLPRILEEGLYQDPKSVFQEGAQDRFGITPTYEVMEERGPDHRKEFKVGVFLEDELVAKGEGPSKQSAQEEAAEKALQEKGWGS